MRSHVLLGGVLAVLLVVMAGCGGSGSTPGGGGGATATPITMTNANGLTATASALSIGSKISFSMKPLNDTNNLGVDWTVACGGNPVTGSVTNGNCGTFAPAHTQDGGSTLYSAPSQVPINASITITATVTGNRSQSSSVSLTIVAAPIGVEIHSAVPSSMVINATTNIFATVTNDAAGTGVIWTVSCGSSVCGSFNPPTALPGYGTVYTAPSAVPTGNSVTITATSLTDTTKSSSVTVQITAPPPPVPVTLTLRPLSVYLETTGLAHSTPLTAVVSNDPADAGVDWSLSCGSSSCGTINASVKAHTPSGGSVSYASPATVPSGGTVTITAKSTTNPAISESTTATIITTLPIIVTMPSAPPAAIATGAQATLSATVANDTANLGVNWTASCGSAGACGSFNLSPAQTASGGQIVYTAPTSIPTGGLITITASSPASTPSNPAVAFTTIVARPPSLTFSQMLPSSMVSATQAPVSATVANDVSPGGVTWSVQCSSTLPGGCGWVVPAHTASGATAIYTAPPVTSTETSVTVTATSTADSSISIVSNPLTVNPSTVSVGFVPSLPANIQPNATVNLIASVANDTTNAGVDWQVCSSGCGFFTIKPATAAIPATLTTPYIPAVAAVTSPCTGCLSSTGVPIPAWPNGLPIPYTAPSDIPSTGIVAIGAAAHADATKANSGTITVTTSLTGPALNGVVQSGSIPVAGTSVLLFAAGTSGYASASSQIAETTAGKNGNFTIPSGYACPSSSSQMYLVATGGSVGTNAANPNLSLMTALGSCSGLASSPLVVNELTTIASTLATSPFASNDALTGNSSYLYLGTSSGNLSGLANAFAMVNSMVDITTGQPKFWTPAENAVVPFQQLNTLANYLNGCVATSGGVEGDGSPCSILFTATDTLGQAPGVFSGAIAPSDTLQAAFNMAQHPSSTYNGTGNPLVGAYTFDRDNNLFTLATSTSAFQPTYTASLVPATISFNYTGGGGLTAASVVDSFAVDANDNLWITDTANGSVIEWNATGAALSPSTGFPAGGGPLAIDANGNIWVSGNGVLNELTSLGAPVPGSPFKGLVGGGNDMAFDAQDNLWIANGAGVNEFSNFGVELSPASGFTNSGISNITAVGIDSSNNVWIGSSIIETDATLSLLSELTNPSGELIVSTSSAGEVLPGIAANGSGVIAAALSGEAGLHSQGGGICKVPPYGGLNTILIPTCYAGGLPLGGNGYTPVPASPQGVVYDGAGGLWMSGEDGTLVLYDAMGNFGGASISLANPIPGSLRTAVDGSGNVWVLLADNTVIEHIGAATPVVTPIALGVKNKTLAAKP
ncbi:beta strand repeat-containing protein [Acidicapsa ligni]|uniref:beta strand repeat-containing protein n=1 Tax=Acidicapsa ligni TaxID=542300 RepID=UPI0021DFD678|nr:hypothetical protein [Acidicapsa ligni]